MRYHQALPADGILADLGVSSHQFDEAERGFSTRFEGELDMRMNPGISRSASDIINQYSEEELSRIFMEYGEITNARKLANLIVNERKNNPVKTTGELVDIIRLQAYGAREQQYFAKVFQALRIEVNEELTAIDEMLNDSAEVLNNGGRLAVISYHSLEDRLVKNFFQTGNREGESKKDFYGNKENVPFRSITKKPIIPSEEELKKNPRSRSAKLRVGERIINN